MYKITTIEDQGKFLVPLNRETEKIYYGLRLLIDAKVLTEPRSFEVSKINRITPNGLVRVTLAQKLFDQHNDYIEKDEDGRVIGMWADYYKSDIPVEDPKETPEPQKIYCKITHTGTKPEVKIGGNFKTFTVKFYDDVGETYVRHGFWKYEIDGKDAQNLIETKIISDDKMKLKFHADEDSYIGKDLVISYVSDGGISTSITMNIAGL